MTGSQHVVITGASGGIGRATARRFAAEGAAITVLARGVTGLSAVADEIHAAGGRALPVSADVADFTAVQDAAERGVAEFGPIDVWVNSAFSTVFAPAWQVTPQEFGRVTEVTYLGSVHGVLVALSHMRARNRGAIVQVGSALGKRSIPLQSAYCGAKHAVDGFVEAVRVELLHEHSDIGLTIVQVPAVNTPQFSWVRSRLPKRPQPVPPIYQPEVVADAIVFAAAHPHRKQYWVGASTVATVLGQRMVPAVLDRYLARTGYSSQQTETDETRRADNLWQPLDSAAGADFGAHGRFDARAHWRSPQAWLAQHAESLAARLRPS
ncbi:SDR family oxidoreductase [Nocardia rhamnosiphila]|uniref:SDR family oxidoreductase n=1 Tax=Nocardia rhamnosiphila TaxID=426716 RepID=UPI0033E7C57A